MKTKTVYLVEAHEFEWHRTILVTTDKNAAVHLAKTHECRCGCQVWEHEVGKLDSGKQVYPW
jgi:hypothetical protein